jgi:hypothetical protein
MQNDPTTPPSARADQVVPDSGHPKAEPPWVLIMGGVIGLALGGWAAYWVGSNSWNGLVSPGWEQAQGTVLQARLEWSGRQLAPTVVYRYDVGGQTYENDRISFPYTHSSGSAEILHRKLTAKYPAGGSCTVYYNPANPATSCLEPGVDYLLLIVGVPLALGLLTAGVVTIRYGLWERRFGPTPTRVYISRPLRSQGD